MTVGEVSRFVEADDASEIGALAARAAAQLVLVGRPARARFRVAIDDQWFEASIELIDGPEGSAS